MGVGFETGPAHRDRRAAARRRRSSPASTPRHRGRAVRRRRPRRRAPARGVRPLARADRDGLRVAHYLTLPALPGPGDRLPGLRPARRGLGPVRHRRPRRSTTASSARTRPGTCRSSSSSLGHVAALVLAHDRALVLYGQAQAAVRSQYWMLGDHGRLHDAGAVAARAGGCDMSRALLFSARRCSRWPAAARRTAAVDDREAASDRLVDLDAEAAAGQRVRHRPDHRRVPADHEQGLLPDRPGDRQGHRGHGHHRGRLEVLDGRDVPLPPRRREGAGADRLGPPRHAGPAAVPRLHQVRRRRQDLGGPLPARRGRPAQDHRRRRPALRLRRGARRAALLRRRRQDLHGEVHPARADHRLRRSTPSDKNTIFTATEEQIFRSEDGGESWRPVERRDRRPDRVAGARARTTRRSRTGPSPSPATAATPGRPSRSCPASRTRSRRSTRRVVRRAQRRHHHGVKGRRQVV